MTNVYLLLGGNLGDREQNLVKATEQIAYACGQIVKTSKVYETKAWGVENQPDFLNQVLIVSSQLTADEVLEKTQQIELDLGRERHQKWHERTIDIDVLYFGQEIINTENLKVPHPQIAFRRFSLVPLAEIAPDFSHPVLNKTQLELFMECEDELDVWEYKNE